MEGGVRRNIALKLKDSAPHKSPSETGRRKEAVKEATVDVAQSPPPPPPPEQLDPPNPQLETTTTAPTMDTSHRNSPLVGTKKVPPEGTLETGDALRWDYKTNILGRAVQDPLIHLCEVCSLPVLIYGRMKRCRHAFCRDCAKRSLGVCPRCGESDQTFEEASMGNVYICTHGGGRYDNKGCGRSYLSQRDLEAHITYRHKDKSQLPPPPPPPGLSLTSQSPLPTLTMPPFFTVPPTGLPPSFAIPGIPTLAPHPSITGPGGQPIFHPNLAQVQAVFVSQPSTAASTIPTTWTTPSAFK